MSIIVGAASIAVKSLQKIMGHCSNQNGRRARPVRLVLYVLLLLCASACAGRKSPSAEAPKSNEPPYPVLMTDSDERRAATLAAWTNFTNGQGIMNSPAPDLVPVTATIRSLPPLAGTPLYLPKVGDGATMNEEETRESLRRFISSTTPLIGADPAQLSLVQRTDLADGNKKARYEQRPFRYALRGDYGVLEITFAPDRRVLQITSTCLPETEQLQRAGAGIRPKLTADQVASQISGKTFTYTDASGILQTLTVTKGEETAVRELVIYPLPRAADPAVLEFHLAWEIAVGRNANQTLLYLDAVKEGTDELLAVKQISR